MSAGRTRPSGPRHPLRIGFDGRAFASPAGGVRRYLSGLTTALVRVAPHVELIAIGAPGDVSATRGVAPPSMQSVPVRNWVPTNLGWSVFALPRAARRARLDVFHAPAYTAPIRGVHPLVLTIHDVSYERHPEWYPYRRDPLRRAFYRACARAADVIVTDSTFSRDEIVAAYDVPPERVRVVPLGVGAPFSPGAVPAVDTMESAGLTILHVGDLHHRRNLGVVIEALAWLRRHDAALGALTLTLVGRDAGAAGELRARATSAGVIDAVHFVTRASDDELVAWYRRAAVMAYPSRYEGFGLPVLEAMACGLPVVASTAASLPEVVGDAGLLVEPSDVRAWVDAIAGVLRQPPRAAALRAAGLRRAATYSWDRSAAATLAVYEEIVAGIARPA